MKTSMFSYPYFVKNVHSLKKLYSHAHILSKKRPLSQKTLCYNVIFSNFPWKFPCYYAHTWAENVHSVKITSYYGRKRSIGCPFFSICLEKITALIPLFCQQKVHSLKNMVNLLKTRNSRNIIVWIGLKCRKFSQNTSRLRKFQR